MGAFKDVTGQKFGKLTVIEVSWRHPTFGCYYWKCQCDCGNTTVARMSALRTGKTKSCGCFRSSLATDRNLKHGLRGSPIYRVWETMHARCNNKKDKGYKFCGAKGIKVCDRWRDLKVFVEDVGIPEKPSRFSRVNKGGDFEPGNCGWVVLNYA